jgi:hypothetical protein
LDERGDATIQEELLGWHILRARRKMTEALLFASTLASMVRFGDVTDFLLIPFVRVRE